MFGHTRWWRDHNALRHDTCCGDYCDSNCSHDDEVAVEIIRLLADRGCSVNARDIDGCTPLTLAFKHHFNGATEALIECGVDVIGFIDIHGTYLHYAVMLDM